MEDFTRYGSEGYAGECVATLSEGVWESHVDAFQKVLMGELQTDVGSMAMQLNSGADTARDKPHIYRPKKTEYLE